MKPTSSILAQILVLAVCWISLLAGARGQALSVLHSFGDGTVANDGGGPESAVIQGNDGNFYGTTPGGGTGSGCVYEITPQGVVTILHSFGDGSVVNDGTVPTSSVVEDANNNFYGTTSSGGSAGQGTVYEISAQGVFSILHNFGDGSVVNDGSVPMAGLLLGADGNLYGTTSAGGSATKGTVFEVDSSHVTTIVHSFGDGTVAHDGAAPGVGLVEDSSGNLYGTTYSGGAMNRGAVYVINAQKQESVLYSFTQVSAVSFGFGSGFTFNGSGGYYPNSRLVLASDGNLYGTTAGSAFGFGTFYKVTPQGQESVVHYFFDGSVANDGQETMATPKLESILIQTSDHNFYGTTSAGGLAGKGTLFKISPQGLVKILHSFGDGTVANDGVTPESGVIEGIDGAFYGTTSAGGSASLGTVFKLAPALPEIVSPMSAAGALGVAFSYQILATGNVTAYAATNLPPGLTIDATTGLISGTPTATGTTKVTLTVTNVAGSTSAPLLIYVEPQPSITSILSEFASTSGFFTYRITASGNPTSFAATGLPAGLTVNALTGLIVGTPTATGTFSITISAINLAGTDTQTLTLVVSSTAPTFSQEYVLLHSFSDGTVANEGAYPGPLIPGLDNTLFGVTSQGGVNGAGTVFNLAPAGTASVFSALSGTTTGSTPQGLVRGFDGSFYGTAHDGGSANFGTIFKVTPDGVVTLLHTFGDGTVANDGANPMAGLIQAPDGTFYGTTEFGGAVNLGAIFKMTPQGAVTIVHSFGDGTVTNDGSEPTAALVEDAGGTFYGTTMRGGVEDAGTVFALSHAGVVTILHSFADGTVANDGQLPQAALALVGTNLYGTTTTGGTLERGTIFKITPSGTETVLHNFGDGTVTNDGVNPNAPLLAVYQPSLIFTPLGIPSGVVTPIFNSTPTLFGTTQNGGAGGQGTVFELAPSGTLTIIHSFADGTVTNDGQTPMTGLTIGTDGNLYGTTVGGGAGSGTAYAIVTNLVPPLSLLPPISYWTCTGDLPPGVTFDSTTGLLSGTPLAGDAFGGYAVAITQIVNGVAGTPQSITIALTQSFAQWVTAHGLSSTATGSTAIPMHDGIPNLLKYLFDIDPTAPLGGADRSALPCVGMASSNGSDFLTLTYRKNAAANGVTTVLQTSSDLVNWTTVDPPDFSQQVGTDTATGDPMMQVGVKTSGGKQFVRLNVLSQ